MKNKKSKKLFIVVLLVVVFTAGIFIGKVIPKTNKTSDNNSETTTEIVEVEVETRNN